MRLSEFDYYLPKDLIAQYPLKLRDASRMMVVDRASGTVRHKRFKDLNFYMRKGDTAVLNNSRVVPARIKCKKATGGRAEIFLLNKVKKNVYEALLRPAGLFPGKRLFCDDGSVLAEVVENREAGKLVKFTDVVNIERDLKRIGQVPLPPYIKRDPEASDEYRYQTIYADREGSTASPTAGLHFTQKTLENLGKKEVGISYITLHVSYGTFAPIRSDEVERHRMHRERFELPEVTRDMVEKVKRKGGKVMAVGTTTARVLEANADEIMRAKGHPLTLLGADVSRVKERGKSIEGYTDLFIYPPYKFKMVDILLTNFHLPRSTLLLLVSAFAGKDLILKAYGEAVEKEYRFYSYGDCMLIL